MGGTRATAAGLLVALGAIGSVVGAAGTATAAGTAHVGVSGSARDAYWWQPEPVTGLIPAPGVPADGLYVASSPSGTQAVSGVSITTPIRSGIVRLTLRVAQREVVNPPNIEAYPSASHWQTGGPQPWSSRPRYEGSAPLGQGIYNTAQTRMWLTVPAVALANGIELVPAPTPGAKLAPTFAISFQPPLATAVSLPSASTPAPTPKPRASHTSPSTSSSSASRSHQPRSTTQTPTHSRDRHHASPSTRLPNTVHPAAPGATPSSSAPAAALPARAVDHDTRNAVLGAVIVAALIAAAGASVSWRRRHRTTAP